VRTEENINLVRQALEENPRTSLRRNNTGIPKFTLNNIIKLDLRWHPYKITCRHELLPGDLPRRRAYSEWLLGRFEEVGFVENIIIGDEAAFAMDGGVNTQNVREYAPSHHPPDFSFDISLSCVGSACGDGSIIGLFFFD